MVGSLRNFSKAQDRRNALRDDLRVNLDSLSDVSLESNTSVHCENLIGSVKVPLGVAGPLKIRGVNISDKDVFIPMATTEGALIASVARGSKAISASGGVGTFVQNTGQTRGPVFYTGSIEKAQNFISWIRSNESVISKLAKKTSKYISYKSFTSKTTGNFTFIRFSFDTSDAMGMNMVTIASEAICHEIEKKTGVNCISVAGNFDIDKKPAWINIIQGRGTEVWAECVIPEKVIFETLHTTAEGIYKVWLSKCMVGSYFSGSLGFNAHFANTIAAFFIATGQDPAHAVEGSNGITTCEVRKNDLYISVYLPSLLVGTVGGGTVLPSQNDALKILGLPLKNSHEACAEVIAGAVLAGELSLLASLASKSLATSHKRLGRSEK